MEPDPWASATNLACNVRSGELSPEDVVESTYARIDRIDDELNAFVFRRDEEAKAAAADAEHDTGAGQPPGRLHGVPIALKDLGIFVDDMPHTLGGVEPIGEMMPPKTSIIVERLQDEGAIVVGSTNSPEFGASADTTNPMFGSTGNPFDPEKTAGGSSGGSAAAVGAGLVPIALGSDIAGSLRIPASVCGTYGLKATPGLVPDASSPDLFAPQAPYVSLGGITRTVEDTAVLLDIIGGYHPRDPLSIPDDQLDYLAATRQSADGLSVAYSPDLGLFEVEPEVREAVESVRDTLDRAGATVRRVDLDFRSSFEEILHAYNALLEPGLAAMFDGYEDQLGIDLLGDHRQELSPHIVDMVERGYEYGAVELKGANAIRTAVFNGIQNVLDGHDLLLTPTCATPPFTKGRRQPEDINGTALESDKEWFLTWPFNLTGHPAASIPAGFSSDGLPIGAQLVGPRFGEETILTASAAIERGQPWSDEYPSFD